MRLILLALVSVLLAQPPAAQKRASTLPEGWKARLDQPAAKLQDVTIDEKEHALTFTTGPAGIFYKPDMKPSGNYELSAAFSQLKPSEHAEGYGLFVGGADLDKDTQRYTYFLIRQDGKFLIKSRDGAATKTIADWTDAPVMREPKGVKTSNTLAIRAVGDLVLFVIDDKPMHKLSRAQAGGDGIAGVRINHNLNVQVTNLTLKKTGGSGRQEK